MSLVPLAIVRENSQKIVFVRFDNQLRHATSNFVRLKCQFQSGVKMRSTLFLTVLWFGAVTSMSGSATAEINVGDDVPDFKMVGSDGETYSNKDFKGKKAFVIAWYPKAFTGG